MSSVRATERSAGPRSATARPATSSGTRRWSGRLASSARLAAFFALAVAGCAAPGPTLRRSDGAIVQEGNATWYGREAHGGPTASGERFDMNAMTAAHLRLPMNTVVEVENRKNGRRVTVRINDRGPYGRGRIIDVSHAAAKALGMLDDGVVPVRIRVMR
ncbi:MAG: septal ring lytic transglycosylase RlpA family protein [Myxococcales bacterium]|nr:septal ring lytic transglycosylase RlpA family protein [Myxococcales bacterium]